TAPTVCCVTPAANCPPSVQPCVSVQVICTPACPRTPITPCPTRVCTVPPQCPIPSALVACPTFGACPSIACQFDGGLGQRQGVVAAPAVQAAGGAAQAALPPTILLSGAICPTFMVGCGGGGGTLQMAAPTLFANCTQVCGPSFLGMGCGGGGTVQMALP